MLQCLGQDTHPQPKPLNFTTLMEKPLHQQKYIIWCFLLALRIYWSNSPHRHGDIWTLSRGSCRRLHFASLGLRWSVRWSSTAYSEWCFGFPHWAFLRSCNMESFPWMFSLWIALAIAFSKTQTLCLAVGTTTGYGQDDCTVGVRFPGGSRILSSPNRPDELWGSPNLLSNEFWELFPRE
jgi:hypothetical protein